MLCFAWIAEPIPHALTGLIGCYLFWVLKVVKFEVAFSGFAFFCYFFWLSLFAQRLLPP